MSATAIAQQDQKAALPRSTSFELELILEGYTHIPTQTKHSYALSQYLGLISDVFSTLLQLRTLLGSFRISLRCVAVAIAVATSTHAYFRRSAVLATLEMTQPTRSHASYSVGIICALAVEKAAVVAMLDEEHPRLWNARGDDNDYTLGRMGVHDVAIACLPAGIMGKASAATVATKMLSSFPIDTGLMVGIGGGVSSSNMDIRLGDVVVSQPDRTHGGVVQWDFGKAEKEGFRRTGSSNKPPQKLLHAIQSLKAKHMMQGDNLPDHLSSMSARLPFMADAFVHQGAKNDQLFQPNYPHQGGDTCGECDRSWLISPRPSRSSCRPVIFYGTIASGDQVVKDGPTRDRIAREEGIICFEMEAAGLMDHFPCMIIRGICDYADSHKNKRWQPYAAATAAAYAKELLTFVPEYRAPEPPTTAGRDSRMDIGQLMEPAEHKSKLTSDQRRCYVESLRFDQIDARHATIKTAHAKTCRWLLSKSEYQDWRDPERISEHHGFLWIKGKAGTGKSTIIKFAHASAKKAKFVTVISFFFNARGDHLEKSVEGMYRSLLLQLLEKLPDLQSVFDLVDSRADTNQQEWSIETLKILFGHAVENLGQRSLICYIDALDECDEDQIREMIAYFENLGRIAILNQIKFLVCFSSRHYPHITIDKSIQLVLEGQEGHQQDLVNYLQCELKAKGNIKDEILTKASGIFLWVVLVVPMLNKEYDHGRIGALRKRLNEIPKGLDELFQDILTRDTQNLEELILCIEWILYARRPLKREELYFAITSGVEADELAAWDPQYLTHDDIERFILSSSKGLAEATKDKQPTVQFIHESVRDYFLKGSGMSTLTKLRSHPVEHTLGSSHDRLKQCCQNFMAIDFTGHLPLDTPLPKASSPEAKELRERAFATFPFLEYAVRNMFYHSDAAQSYGVSQRMFLDLVPLRTWIWLDNLIEKYQVRLHTPDATMVYILAEKGLSSLIKLEIEKSPQLDIEGERYGFPLAVACAESHERVVELLLSGGADTNVRIQRHHSILALAIEKGNERIIELLLDNGADANARGKSNSGLRDSHLYTAVDEGHEKLAQLLLDHGAEVNAQGGEYGNALQAASFASKPEVVQMLLDHGAEVNTQGGRYGNALQAASFNGKPEVVQMLLDHGAEVNTQGGPYGNALQAASFNGKPEVVQMLLDHGAEVNAHGGRYGTALQAASDHGKTETIQMLLDHGAEVNAQGGDYGNALQAASFASKPEVVQMLLDHGAEVNAQGGQYGNALQAALYISKPEVVQMLLDHGAEVNAQGGRYGNALQAASYLGQTAVIHILLDHGAMINAQGGPYGTALQAAARGQEYTAMRILLNHGADTSLLYLEKSLSQKAIEIFQEYRGKKRKHDD